MTLPPVTDPYRCIALGVLRQATEDDAWGWMLDGAWAVQFWCAVADISYEAIVSRARAAGGEPGIPDHVYLRESARRERRPRMPSAAA